MTASQNLATALFALLDARGKHLSIKAGFSKFPTREDYEEAIAMADASLTKAAERYESAVVESCREAIPVREVVYTGGTLNP